MTLAAIHHGSALEVLATLEAGSIHAVCCSPPYWGGVRRYAGLDDTQLGLECTPEEYVTRLGRRSIGIELSEDYVALARCRLADEASIGNVDPDAAPEGAEVQGSLGL